MGNARTTRCFVPPPPYCCWQPARTDMRARAKGRPSGHNLCRCGRTHHSNRGASPPSPKPTSTQIPTGQLSQSLGHGNVQKDASSDDSAWSLVLQEEQIARLVPVSPKTPEEASVNTRIELDTDDTLITGDPVDAPLALDVPKALAERLGLGERGQEQERGERGEGQGVGRERVHGFGWRQRKWGGVDPRRQAAGSWSVHAHAERSALTQQCRMPGPQSSPLTVARPKATARPPTAPPAAAAA